MGDNSTLVENHKKTHGERSTFRAHFVSVFGDRWWLWPLPVPSHLPANYLEAAIPDSWSECVDDRGRTYYYNKDTEKSQWERPQESQKDPARQRAEDEYVGIASENTEGS